MKTAQKQPACSGDAPQPDEAAADSAIEAMHEKELDGRPLVVNEAKPPKPRDEF